MKPPHVLLCWALVLLGLLLPDSGHAFGWSEPERKEEVPESMTLHLDRVEGVVAKVWSMVVRPGNLARAVFGTSMLIYGNTFKYVALQLQAFRVRGWSDVKEGVLELAQTYRETRVTLQKNYPNLMEAKEVLLESKRRFEQVAADLASVKHRAWQAKKDGQSSKETRLEIKAAEAKAKRDLAACREEINQIRAALSTFHAVGRSVDARRIRKVCTGLYTGLLQAFAVRHSSALTKLALGVNLGSLMTVTVGSESPLKKLAVYVADTIGGEEISKGTRHWLEAAIKWTATAAGLTLAAYFSNAALTASTSLFGATILVGVISKWVDPHLERAGQATIREDKMKRAVASYLLAAMGISLQVRGMAPDWGVVTQSLVWLPRMVEGYFRRRGHWPHV